MKIDYFGVLRIAPSKNGRSQGQISILLVNDCFWGAYVSIPKRTHGGRLLLSEECSTEIRGIRTAS
jgi:hypothetical protein